MTLSHDTRKSSTARLLSLDGYHHDPVVDDTLPSGLPRLTRRTGRLIQLGHRAACEIWSPNSAVHPYLPGVVPTGFDFPFLTTLSTGAMMVTLAALTTRFLLKCSLPSPRGEGSFAVTFLPKPMIYRNLHQFFSYGSPLSRNLMFVFERLPSSFVDAIHTRISYLQRVSAENDKITIDYKEVWANRPVLPAPWEITRLRSIDNYEAA